MIEEEEIININKRIMEKININRNNKRLKNNIK